MKVAFPIVALLLIAAITTTIYFANQKNFLVNELDDANLDYTTELSIKNIKTSTKGKSFILAQNAVISPKDSDKFKESPFSNEIKVEVLEDSDNEVTLKITDPNNPAFTIPEDSQYFPSNQNSKDTKTGKKSYKYTTMEGGNLFKLERILDDGSTETIFDTKGFRFAFSKYYNYIGTSLSNDYLYGFGERRKSFRFTKSGKYTIFPKDQYTQIDEGLPNQQLYGYHPMWLQKGNSGNFHVGFLKSSSALQIEIDAGKSMGFHIVGGNIIIKFFLGDKNPENAIKAYHRYIKGFSIHPFWSQGYHNSRWGYKTSNTLLQIRDQFDQNDHPIDVLWNDLDYMVDYQDFTLQKDYKAEEMNQLTDMTNDAAVHWVPLIDMGVAINVLPFFIKSCQSDGARDGLARGIFLQSSVYDHPLIACVWPGSVYFPDFNHPGSEAYWIQALKSMNTVLNTNPTGFWIDMNENSNFIAGERHINEECPEANPVSPPSVKPEIDDNLYIPFHVAGDRNLANKTTTMSTMHYNGSDAYLIPNQHSTELFFHPFNNYGEQIITYKAVQQMTGDPLVFTLTRGSVYGTGRFVQHWTGDNLASWDFYKFAVSEVLPFSLFGIPMTGNDICGFAGDTNPELCARWLSYGAWMPFSRNHNSNVSIPQEPFAFPDSPYVLEASRTAYKTRYSHLKWMYSVFVRQYENDAGFGVGTVMKPIWWNFPSDEQTYKYEDTLFMFGDEYLVAPVLKQGDSNTQLTNIEIYFPAGNKWYKTSTGDVFDGGKVVTYPVKFNEEAPYFLRSGYVVSRQAPQNRARRLNNVFQLHVALDNNKATGYILTLDSYEPKNVQSKCLEKTDCLISLTVTYNQPKNSFTLDVKAASSNTVFEKISFDHITVFGLDKKIDLALAIDITQAGSFEIPIATQ